MHDNVNNDFSMYKHCLLSSCHHVVTGQGRVDIGRVLAGVKLPPPELGGVVWRRGGVITPKLVTVAVIEHLAAPFLSKISWNDNNVHNVLCRPVCSWHRCLLWTAWGHHSSPSLLRIPRNSTFLWWMSPKWSLILQTFTILVSMQSAVAPGAAVRSHSPMLVVNNL